MINREADGTILAITEQSAWWRRSVEFGAELVRIIGMPQEGFYERKLVKGGVPVGVRIWREAWIDERGRLVSDERLMCEVNGQPDDAEQQWTWITPCTRERCLWLIADREHARDWRPDDHEATPEIRIDLGVAPSVF